MEEFAPGEVVKLKSGSPDMTVVWISGKTVNCIWYYNGKYEQEKFPVEVLKKVELSNLPL